MGRLGSRFAVVVVFGGSSLPAVFGGRALSLPVMSLGTAVVGGSMIVVVVIIVGMAPVVLSQGMVAEEVVVVVAAAVAAHVLSM
jgi:hypothetical protein